MDPILQLRINICFPDSISFYGVDPIARDLLVISHWKQHNKGNTKLKLIQELNYRWRHRSPVSGLRRWSCAILPLMKPSIRGRKDFLPVEPQSGLSFLFLLGAPR